VLGLTVADAHRGVPGGHSVAVAPGSVVAETLLLDSLAWSRQSYTQLGAPCHVTFPPRPCAAHARAGVLPDDGPRRGGEHRDDVRHPRRASRTCWRAQAGAGTRRSRFSRTASVRLSYQEYFKDITSVSLASVTVSVGSVTNKSTQEHFGVPDSVSDVLHILEYKLPDCLWRRSAQREASTRTKPRCRGMRTQWTPDACSASRQASPARRSAESTAACPGPQRHPCRARTSAQSIQARCMLWGFLWVTAWLQALEGWLPVFNNGAGRATRTAPCKNSVGSLVASH
jgi:hypothetical protein